MEWRRWAWEIDQSHIEWIARINVNDSIFNGVSCEGKLMQEDVPFLSFLFMHSKLLYRGNHSEVVHLSFMAINVDEVTCEMKFMITFILFIITNHFFIQIHHNLLSLRIGMHELKYEKKNLNDVFGKEKKENKSQNMEIQFLRVGAIKSKFE